METETIQTKKPSLFGMIFSPGEQFERIRERPVIWIPFILLTILGTILAVLAVVNFDYSALAGIEMSKEEEEMTRMFGIIGAGFAGFIGVPIGMLFYSAIYFLAAKIAKSEVTFKQMLSVILFASFISTIGSIINQLIIIAIDGNPEVILTSLNSLIGAEGALGVALGSIEVFGIWYCILLVIGLIKVAKLSKPAAITIVVIFFILGVLFSVGGVTLNEGLNQIQ